MMKSKIKDGGVGERREVNDEVCLEERCYTERVWEEAMPPTDDSTRKLKKETLPGLAVGLLSGRV